MPVEGLRMVRGRGRLSCRVVSVPGRSCRHSSSSSRNHCSSGPHPLLPDVAGSTARPGRWPRGRARRPPARRTPAGGPGWPSDPAGRSPPRGSSPPTAGPGCGRSDPSPPAPASPPSAARTPPASTGPGSPRGSPSGSRPARRRHGTSPAGSPCPWCRANARTCPRTRHRPSSPTTLPGSRPYLTLSNHFAPLYAPLPHWSTRHRPRPPFLRARRHLGGRRGARPAVTGALADAPAGRPASGLGEAEWTAGPVERRPETGGQARSVPVARVSATAVGAGRGPVSPAGRSPTAAAGRRSSSAVDEPASHAVPPAARPDRPRPERARRGRPPAAATAPSIAGRSASSTASSRSTSGRGSQRR